MDPTHRTREQARLENAIRAVVLVLVIGLVLEMWLGVWDKFFAVAVEWFPIWWWGA